MGIYTEQDRRNLEAVLFFNKYHYHYNASFLNDGKIVLYKYNYDKARHSPYRFDYGAFEKVGHGWDYSDIICLMCNDMFDADPDWHKEEMLVWVAEEITNALQYYDSPEEFINHDSRFPYGVIKDNVFYTKGYSYNSETGEGTLFDEFEFTDMDDFEKKIIDWYYKANEDNYITERMDWIWECLIEEQSRRIPVVKNGKLYDFI